MSKIIASLIAGLFATAAFAQAPVAATTAPATTPAVVKTEAKVATAKVGKTAAHHKIKASAVKAPVVAAKADTKEAVIAK